jgi:hypothetical protein
MFRRFSLSRRERNSAIEAMETLVTIGSVTMRIRAIVG